MSESPIRSNTSSTPRTIAWFKDIDEAHHAVQSLERHGIDATYIEMARSDSVEERRMNDRRTMGWLERLAAMSVVAGLIAGACVGLVVGVLLADTQLVFITSIMAGAIIGAALVGFTTLAVSLPVSVDSYDMHGDEPNGSDWVAVSGPTEMRSRAGEVFRSLDTVEMREAA